MAIAKEREGDDCCRRSCIKMKARPKKNKNKKKIKEKEKQKKTKKLKHKEEIRGVQILYIGDLCCLLAMVHGDEGHEPEEARSFNLFINFR